MSNLNTSNNQCNFPDEKGRIPTSRTTFMKQDIETGRAELIQHLPAAPLESHAVATWAVTICIICTTINCLLAFNFPIISSPPLLEPVFLIARDHFRLLQQSVAAHGFTTPLVKEISSKLRYPNGLFVSINEGIYPSNGTLSINQTTSTIVQFEPVDSGVQHCEIGLRLTPIQSISASITAATELPFSISIYQIDGYYPLDKQKYPHSVVPRRLTTVGDIAIVPGFPVKWSRPVKCTTNEVLAFEISCSETETTSGCSVEWWQKQNQEDPSNVLSMVQRAVW